MKRVHKMCTYILRVEAVARPQKFDEWPRCKECPAWEKHKDYGRVKSACRLGAEEAVNIVKWGNPWGRKYKRSRSYWPNRGPK